MKQIKAALFLLVVCTLAFSSCKKDSSTKTSISVSAKINGTTKTTTNVVASYYKSEGALQLIAQFSATESISLMIQNVKVGSFDASTDAALGTYTDGSGLSGTYISDSGTIVVSSFGNGSTSGTFNFVATNTSDAAATITSGTFTSTYISE